MKITKETDYAFRIVLFLSMNQESEKKFNGDELVEVNQIPKNLGKRILTKLADKGIIISKKGIGGGFILGKDRKEITLFDVMSTVENMDFKDCAADPASCGFKHGACSINFEMAKIREVLYRELKAVTFEDLVKREKSLDCAGKK